jgi:hypothetical protein
MSIKNFLITSVILAACLHGGTMSAPTPLENGKSITTSADIIQNFYIFTMQNRGNFLFMGAGYYDIYDSDMNKIRTNQGPITAETPLTAMQLEKGTYLLKVYLSNAVGQPLSTVFSFYSSQIGSSSISSAASSLTVTTGCNEELFARVTSSGVWHLLGAKSTGCTKTKLKALGASAVWTYSSTTSDWAADDVINDGEGVWIRK